MKTVYYVQDEEYGEIEGMFDMQGECLGSWYSNDANWRHEYFEDFMANLGVEVKDAPSIMRDALVKKLREECNIDPSEYGEEE